MDVQQLKERYQHLYDYMSASRDPKNMKIFGAVMTEMMNAMLQKMPAEAEEMVEKLESIKWHQFLTPKEAETIVNNMQPKAPWNREVWNSAMDSLNLIKEEEPFFNRCALWAEMNKQYSDHGESIATLLGKPLNEIPADVIVPAMHRFALDTLKDKDDIYNIRRYFNV